MSALDQEIHDEVLKRINDPSLEWTVSEYSGNKSLDLEKEGISVICAGINWYLSISNVAFIALSSTPELREKFHEVYDRIIDQRQQSSKQAALTYLTQ